MDVNLSLDEIIKKKKSKNPTTRRKSNSGRRSRSSKSKSLKNTRKPILKSVRKSNTSPFKRNLKKNANIRIPDARLKLSGIQDARFKISQKKNRSPLVIGKGTIVDARLKIEAHKQMKQKKLERKKPSGITTYGGDGIIERRINANTKDSGIRVEYEDEDMNLEYETLEKKNWSAKPFLVRRTIKNDERWPSARSMSDEDRFRDSSPPFYSETRSFKEVTRTIANSNYRKPSVNSNMRSYSRRSPIRQYDSFDNNRKMRSSRLSSPPQPAPSLRDLHHHLIIISNLHENVTGEDIKELFEDVGDLVYAKMIRDGVAEVAYKSQRDAMKAVEIYHNRQLDGLPMKCVLVSTNRETSYRDTSYRDSSSRNVPPINTFSPVEPDTHLIKKALFSSH